MKSDLATRFIGFCPVCEGTFKLRSVTCSAEHATLNGDTRFALVHHGYQRPGDGYIHGDCFSVGMDPHETSPKAAQGFKAQCEETLVSQQSRLAALEAGEVKSFMTMSASWDRVRTVTTHTVERKTVKNVVTGEEKVTTGIVAEYEFKQATESAIREMKAHIRSTESHITRMEGHLKDWAPKPLTTFEESVSALKVQKDAAKGVKTAARQAKVAAKIASYQKRIDSAAKNLAKGKKGTKSTLADIFESMSRAWHDLGYSSMVEFYKAVDRNTVWEGLGLLIDAPYRSEADDKNADVLSAMRQARYT